jgi:hypothetical protein
MVRKYNQFVSFSRAKGRRVNSRKESISVAFLEQTGTEGDRKAVLRAQRAGC